MSFFVISLVFWYGSTLVASLQLNTKNFFICLMVSYNVLGYEPSSFCLGYFQSIVFGSNQSGSVFSFVPDMSSAQGAANDIVNLLGSIPEIDAESPEGKIPRNVEGHIRLEDVHFRYPTRPGVRVLRDLSIEVKPGTYIALVGASGCGKSTVYVDIPFLLLVLCNVCL
jgi:ATP-binding cassette subfamily B (MDR/TAP) protein 1